MRFSMGLFVALALSLGCSSESSTPDVAVADPGVAEIAATDVLGIETIEISGELPVDPPSAAIPLLPGLGQEGYNEELEQLARLYDRQFYAFNAFPSAANQDLSVDPLEEADREAIRAFLQDGDGWDFEAETGLKETDIITSWHKVAGLYGGVGMAADAYRYGVLRDQGYDEVEIDRAREFLLRVLDSLHLATSITGVPGVIARGFIRTDVPVFILFRKKMGLPHRRRFRFFASLIKSSLKLG